MVGTRARAIRIFQLITRSPPLVGNLHSTFTIGIKRRAENRSTLSFFRVEPPFNFDVNDALMSPKTLEGSSSLCK